MLQHIAAFLLRPTRINGKVCSRPRVGVFRFLGGRRVTDSSVYCPDNGSGKTIYNIYDDCSETLIEPKEFGLDVCL